MNSKNQKYRITAESFEIIVVQDNSSRIFQTYFKTARMKYFRPLHKFGIWVVGEELSDIIEEINSTAALMVRDSMPRKKPKIQNQLRSNIYGGRYAQKG